MRYLAVFTVAALFSAAGYASGEGEFYKWSNRTGATIEAEFVKIEGPSVVLKNKAGDTFSIRGSMLSAESRELALKLNSGETPQAERPQEKNAAETQPQASSPAPGQKNEPVKVIQPSNEKNLPIFSNGDCKSLNTRFRTPSFVVEVLRTGEFMFKVLDAEQKSIGPGIRISVDYAEAQGPWAQNVLKNMKWIDPPQPAPEKIVTAAAPAVFALKRLVEGDITVDTELTVTEDSITINAWADKEIDEKHCIRVNCLSGPSISFDLSTPVEERRQKAAGSSIKIVPYDGKTREFNYGENIKGYSKDLESISISGDVYGGKNVSFECNNKKVSFAMRLQSTLGAHDGFSLSMLKYEVKKKLPAYSMSIKVK